MPVVKAFRGLRYNEKKFRYPANLFAPPYDIISAREQEKLYRSHPHNVVRLELGRIRKTDNADNNRYTRAAAILKDWIKQQVLIEDPLPSFYIYEQRYTEEGKKKVRLGFLGAMKLDEKSVLKHENTLEAPKKDRMELLKKVETNLSPIFGLVEDKLGQLQKILKKTTTQKPLYSVTLAGVCHRIYKESNPDRCRAISKVLADKSMHIADGHHRFEVACQYRRFKDAEQGSACDAPWQYALVYFSDVLHNPFKIYPTHRLLKVNRPGEVYSILRSLGTVKRESGLKTILKILGQEPKKTARVYPFGVYTKKEGFFTVTLGKDVVRNLSKDPVAHLDVSVLHDKILKARFGLDAVEKSDRIDFTRDAVEAVSKVRAGLFDVAFFLRPTSLSEMLQISSAGKRMPQKSTYFYPKLVTGLVFHRLKGEGV